MPCATKPSGWRLARRRPPLSIAAVARQPPVSLLSTVATSRYQEGAGAAEWSRPAADSGLGAVAARRQVQFNFQDPFASLNPRLRVSELLHEGVAALQPEMCVVKYIADGVAVMRNLCVEEQGNCVDVRNKPQRGYTCRLMAASP